MAKAKAKTHGWGNVGTPRHHKGGTQAPLFQLEDFGGYMFFDEHLEPLPQIYDYAIVETIDQLDTLVWHLTRVPLIAFDTEFGGGEETDPRRADTLVAGVSFAVDLTDIGSTSPLWQTDGGRNGGLFGWYIPLNHRGQDHLRRVVEDVAIDVIRWALTTKDVVTHNGKVEAHAMARYGIPFKPRYDTLILAHILGHKHKGLKVRTTEDLHRKVYDLNLLFDRAGQQKLKIKDVRFTRLDDLGQYAAADAINTLGLFKLYHVQLQDDIRWTLAERVRTPAIQSIIAIEARGLPIDKDHFDQIIPQFQAEMDAITHELQVFVGKEFNPNATEQVSTILAQDLGVVFTQKTPTGKPSMDDDYLKELLKAIQLDILQNPWMNPGPTVTGNTILDEAAPTPQDQRPRAVFFIERYLRRKSLATLVSGYDLRGHIVGPHPLDDQLSQVLTNYNPTGTEVGRLSSSDFNAQKIGARTEDGRKIRNGFVAPQGWIWASVDLSQIHPRIFAYIVWKISGDSSLLDAYRRGEDIYKFLASLALEKPVKEITKGERSAAKVLVLALLYLASPAGLFGNSQLDELDPSVEKIRAWLTALFTAAPGARFYHLHAIWKGIHDGYTESLWGFRRSFPGLQWASHKDMREAVNHPIIGTESDIALAIMVWVDQILKDLGLDEMILPLIPVHDELVYLCREEYLAVTEALGQHTMTQVIGLGAPMKSDVEVGYRWGTLIDIKEARQTPAQWDALIAKVRPEDRQSLVERRELAVRIATQCLGPPSSAMVHQIATIQATPSPFLDMPTSTITTPFDLSTVPLEQIHPYLETAAYLNTPLDLAWLPELDEAQPAGYILNPRQRISKKGNPYYTSTLIYRGGFLDLVAFHEGIIQPGLGALVGEWSSYRDRPSFQVSTCIPQTEGASLADLLEVGEPHVVGTTLINFRALKRKIAHATKKRAWRWTI
jgi:DNA polymerase I-like protein with 3'-5' exonuclease and polymerase domains